MGVFAEDSARITNPQHRTSRLITIENLKYYTEVKGFGQPIICFHGFAENLSTWEFIQLNDCQMVLVDLIGHGHSEKPHSPEPYSLPNLLRHLHELIDHLGFTRYFLLGYSMGGRIALAYGLAYPSEVQGLILESSSYGVCHVDSRARRRQQDVWLAEAIQEKGVEWFNQYWSNLDLFASQNQLPQEIRSKINARRLQNAPHGLANTLLGSGQGIFPCLKDQITDLSIPTLYINGEYDEKYKKIGQDFIKLNPQIKREIIPGVGHNSHIENPAAFQEAVNGFLGGLLSS
ncbi:2-succinyl-6-hydroxy-2,4-cyclohexadiene-1-carboxylate synthase [Desulfitobacterium sp. PCE1]|uniref:2-succinyl-6-hydroxy-2, 4-cyclohexadiene-1-carboxylate synthase n=1 Tax=Desulfitobacterium sp. PCE1 TaxID=146907 RepID=UPI00036EE6D4|nr:2-succinyl-6-hydroxy-2,4-cyclohexadiene-1-carboxylate synthase [Desulfitobacterium sp. PCE1]